MKIAVIQFNSNDCKEKNVTRAVKFIKAATKRGAKFILLPEVFVWRGKIDSTRTIASIAEDVNGPTIRTLRVLAKMKKIHILAGSIYEKAPGTRKAYNASALIAPDGSIQAVYRKINLFQARVGGKRINEEKYFWAGKRAAMARVGEFAAGLSICYDVRFPRLYQRYRARGANILCVPSNFAKQTGEAHWESLLRARAIENLSYVLAPNQCGKSADGVTAYGNSMIIDPWGKILARAPGSKEKIIYADISLGAIKKVQSILPGVRKDAKKQRNKEARRERISLRSVL